MNKLNSKAVMALGCFTILALLILSLLFWKERMLYTDMAFHTYALAQSKWFAIQNYRFGAAFTQVFPLVGFKLGLPLKWILCLYSSSFYVCYLLYFIIIIYAFKQYEMGVAFALSLVMLSSCSFFWAQSELPQGLAFLLLALSAVLWGAHRNWILNILLLLPVFTVVVFFHPLIIFPLVFAIAYFSLNKNISYKYGLVLLLLSGILLLIKSLAFKTGSYESEKMDGLTNVVKLFPNYLTIKSNRFFAQQLVRNYFFFTASMVVVLGYYLYKRYFLKFGLLLVTVLVYVFIVNVSFPQLSEGPYLQNLHLPLGLIVALPLAIEILPLVKWQYWLPLLILVVCARLGIIFCEHPLFTSRVKALYNLVGFAQTQNGVKFWVPDNELPTDIYLDIWALPYETLIVSSLGGAQNAVTIALQSNVEQNTSLAEGMDFFINPYWDGNVDKMPVQYFYLKPASYNQIRPPVYRN